MCRRQEEEKYFSENQLEKKLQSMVIAQMETQELWEIDDCIRFLFELSNYDE